ncbi:MAG: hypothetical protein QOC82_3346 [Frankiaceae bacterium]|nr:hypothetical protein [Frankiaceae bacterium]
MSTQPAVRLADGRCVTVRPLCADDAGALIDAVEHEDPWDLRRRFMGTPPPARTLARQLARADGFHDLVLGAFDPDGRLVGVAQFDRLDDAATAELAVEVSHDWQRRRLGTILLSELAELARARGVHEFTASYYGDNVPIRRLLRKVGHASSSGLDHGTGYARINLDADVADVADIAATVTPLCRLP